MSQSHIRNFCIIAHIDHGKSTLADRLLEFTHTVKMRDMQAQLLDSNPIERERGITIKLAPVRMVYKMPNAKLPASPARLAEAPAKQAGRQMPNENKKLEIGNWKLDISSSEYILNLIDTPGHVDFNYEVSRSLAACEGAVLVVDATQGVQAQTLANLNLARKQNLTIIPLINKIDLPNANIPEVTQQLAALGFAQADIISISAKSGTNIDLVLKAIIERVPAPKGIQSSPLRALIFSSLYDTHKGVVVYVRVVDGEINSSKLEFMASGMEIEPIEVGYFLPQMKVSDSLLTGEVGYIATGLKDVAQAKVGDTITMKSNKREAISKNDDLSLISYHLSPLPGYKEPKPMVFVGLFPIESDKINEVREALGKLRLSDSAFTYKPISSLALGHGFHCGFLGLLHAEVVQERLSREFNLALLATAPTVEYRITVKSNKREAISKNDDLSLISYHLSREYITIQSASEYPDPSTIEQAYEPIMELTIFSPKRYVGAIMQLAQEKRAEFIDLQYIGTDLERAEGALAKFSYIIPLSEMIIDFFDRLKSITEGYASLDYEFFDYQPVDVVKLDILLNHEKVDAFSQLIVEARAPSMGRMLVQKLAQVLPRQQFNIPVQAAIGGNVIARADVKPFRKDVTQKLYGGDRTRKDKLLEAQKKGKARMKLVGRVEIPPSAFLSVFKKS